MDLELVYELEFLFACVFLKVVFHLLPAKVGYFLNDGNKMWEKVKWGCLVWSIPT